MVYYLQESALKRVCSACNGLMHTPSQWQLACLTGKQQAHYQLIKKGQR